MKKWVGLILIGLTGATGMAAQRVVQDFNRDWRFKLGDFPAAVDAAYTDSDWRTVKLPHDWSVEQAFTQKNTGGCTAFLPGGIGWYRKTFTVPASEAGRVVRIDFDGVYNNSEVWINGHRLGKRPYGYIPFSYDLTGYLNYGGKNTLVVRVDRSAYMDCRWYPGSGIYRNVKLVTQDRVHIAQYGLFVTTRDNRTVVVRSTVINGSQSDKMISVKTDLQDATGKSVGFKVSDVRVAAGQSSEVEQRFELAHPTLWNTQRPYLYTAEVALEVQSKVLDGTSTTFGVRDLRYDPDHGFFLNGVHTLIKGVCLHHDGGCVGAAVPIGVWERRLRLLKEAGCNAIRTAHNPPAAEFLDLCDRMGFLVQDEAFDEWFNPKDKKANYNQKGEDPRTVGYSTQFGAWAERDIRTMVQRDRNHPSIIMWSIGNEIEWTYPEYGRASGYWDKKYGKNYYWDEPPLDTAQMKANFAREGHGEHVLAEQAADLSRWVKEEDVSRPVTANVVIPSVSHFSGYTDALDIVGYSYRTVLNDWGHKQYPEKMLLGTENWVQWNEWKGVLEHPHMAGIFMWTGVDYLGESRAWPTRATSSGMLNTAGFRKPNYWFFKTFWNEQEPMAFIATQPLKNSNYLVKDGRVVENPENPRIRKWGWPDVVDSWSYTEGEPIYIEVYSNCEEIELFLNNQSLGKRRLADCPDRLMKWSVPFKAGVLKAVGRNSGRDIVVQKLETAGPPVAIHLTTDKGVLRKNGKDVVHCVAQLMDAQGHRVKQTNAPITFKVKGDARNIGVDNGAPDSIQRFQSDVCITDQGHCLMILQAGETTGELTVTASGRELKGAAVQLLQR